MMKILKYCFNLLCIQLISFSTISLTAEAASAPSPAQYIILFIWDGLRPDSVTPENTPNLYQLRQSGSNFTDNHSSYPTLTMMNAASFATGDRAGKTGFFGNTLWHPGIHGTNSANKPIDFNQPVFTEDYKLLQSLNTDELFYVNTLFNAAHAEHLQTAAIGKSGPAFMQDYLSSGYTLDEKHVYPLAFAKQLQQDGYPLPAPSPNDFNKNELILKSDNGNPTAAESTYYLADGVTPDPSDRHGSPYNRANEYMMKIYLNEIVIKNMPTLSVVWMRNPDTTEHSYGPGTFNYRDALQNNDKMLGELIQTLKDKQLYSKTDIIIVSDHAHSNVSGPLDQFPLRDIKNGKVSNLNTAGYSVSGEIRTADLLNQAGFHAFDGDGCTYNPILSGIKKDNAFLYPTKTDMTGKICGKVNKKYLAPAYEVPKTLPQDAIIVAANGGSVYFYIPSHDKKLVEKLVTFLATHSEYDTVFVDNNRYGTVAGTIPLQTIGIENTQGRSPDVITGLAYNATAKINGLPGIEFSDSANTRGMHGSFSPIDVHNFLMASGPDFREKFVDTYPTANVDVAPTIAYLLGLPLPKTDGRVLFEALKNVNKTTYSMHKIKITSAAPLQGLKIVDILDKQLPQTQFSTTVIGKTLSTPQGQYYYFDYAKGLRK